MKAFVLENSGVSLRHDYPEPDVPAGWVKVRPLVAGVCNTDLELARGYMGFEGVLGHEFVGKAESGVLAGRRVVGGINFGCGTCSDCRSSMARHCSTRTVLGILGSDGVFADSFVIPEANLIEVPDAVRDEDASFTEPLAAACEILDQIGPERGRAAVLGAGKLGSLIAQVLAAAGFETDLIGRHLDEVAWIADQGVRLVGATADRDQYDLVVEATGSSEGLNAAIGLVRPRGHLVLKTTVADQHSVDLAPIVINEISIVGSRCGRFEPALDLLASGKIVVAPLISARFDFNDMEEGFAHAGRRGVRKVLIRHD
jgi:threonine dehydrogenase-like Zn-dependent dehydrogenase